MRKNFQLIASRIYPAFKHTRLRITFGSAEEAFRPCRTNIQVMATLAKAVQNGLSRTFLRISPIQKMILRMKEPRKMFAAEFWRFDRGLEVHIEDKSIQQELELPLVLLIPAHASKGKPALTAPHRNSGADCCSRLLKWSNDIGMIKGLEMAIRKPRAPAESPPQE